MGCERGTSCGACPERDICAMSDFTVRTLLDTPDFFDQSRDTGDILSNFDPMSAFLKGQTPDQIAVIADPELKSILPDSQPIGLCAQGLCGTCPLFEQCKGSRLSVPDVLATSLDKPNTTITYKIIPTPPEYRGVPARIKPEAPSVAATVKIMEPQEGPDTPVGPSFSPAIAPDLLPYRAPLPFIAPAPERPVKTGTPPVESSPLNIQIAAPVHLQQEVLIPNHISTHQRGEGSVSVVERPHVIVPFIPSVERTPVFTKKVKPTVVIQRPIPSFEHITPVPLKKTVKKRPNPPIQIKKEVIEKMSPRIVKPTAPVRAVAIPATPTIQERPKPILKVQHKTIPRPAVTPSAKPIPTEEMSPQGALSPSNKEGEKNKHKPVVKVVPPVFEVPNDEPSFSESREVRASSIDTPRSLEVELAPEPELEPEQQITPIQETIEVSVEESFPVVDQEEQFDNIFAFENDESTSFMESASTEQYESTIDIVAPSTEVESFYSFEMAPEPIDLGMDTDTPLDIETVMPLIAVLPDSGTIFSSEPAINILSVDHPPFIMLPSESVEVPFMDTFPSSIDQETFVTVPLSTSEDTETEEQPQPPFDVDPPTDTEALLETPAKEDTPIEQSIEPSYEEETVIEKEPVGTVEEFCDTEVEPIPSPVLESNINLISQMPVDIIKEESITIFSTTDSKEEEIRVDPTESIDFIPASEKEDKTDLKNDEKIETIASSGIPVEFFVLSLQELLSELVFIADVPEETDVEEEEEKNSIKNKNWKEQRLVGNYTKGTDFSQKKELVRTIVQLCIVLIRILQ